MSPVFKTRLVAVCMRLSVCVFVYECQKESRREGGRERTDEMNAKQTKYIVQLLRTVVKIPSPFLVTFQVASVSSTRILVCQQCLGVL